LFILLIHVLYFNLFYYFILFASLSQDIQHLLSYYNIYYFIIFFLLYSQ
jgi:hypothetical protein